MDIVGGMDTGLKKATQVRIAKANLAAIRTTPLATTIKEDPQN
jgi:hypothetical protein